MLRGVSNTLTRTGVRTGKRAVCRASRTDEFCQSGGDVTCFPVGRKSRPRSTKQANRALRPKNDSLRSPTTNRQPGGDIAAWGKPQNCGPQSLLQSVDGVFALHGDAVPKPLGFTALGQQWLAYM